MIIKIIQKSKYYPGSWSGAFFYYLFHKSNGRNIPVVRVNAVIKPFICRFYKCKKVHTVSTYFLKEPHCEQHRNEYSIPYHIWVIQRKTEIFLFILTMWFGFSYNFNIALKLGWANYGPWSACGPPNNLLRPPNNLHEM